MRTNEKQRMYENSFLELLSQSGPKMMITFHLSIISSMLIFGFYKLSNFSNLFYLILVFIAGVLFWTLAEYFLHRFVFHFENESKLIKAFHYAMHGYHHENPNDTNRLFMPPVPAALFLFAFFGIFYMVIGLKAWIFLPGFELGYLVYSFMHFSMHTRRSPKGLEGLWHHHILHHYKEHEKAYGVSSRFWDRFFNTMPGKN